jgi:2-oxoglutarate ferredoxin oxidoreductase subunit beta
VLRLRRLKADYEPTDRAAALHQVMAQQAKGEMLTGLLYINGDAEDLHTALNTVATPLNALRDADLCPGSRMLDKLNASLR